MKAGAPVNTPNASGSLPLQVAARRGAVRCVETLISYGAEAKPQREEDKKKPKKTVLKVLEKKKSSKTVNMHKIGVKTPDKKVKIQVDMNWKVGDVITILHQKLPNSQNYKLFMDNMQLDSELPLSHYPKIEKEKVNFPANSSSP